MIDLHIHSTASDGSLPPTEIINMAVTKGLSAIAITDHDTIDGVKDAIESGIPHNLEFITGVELSAEPISGYGYGSSIHILGYGFSIYDRSMNTTLEKLRNARSDRNPFILEKLKQLGFPLSTKEIIEICGQCQMGRPHIAKAMVEKGYVASFDDAFDLYLGKGKPAYVDKFRLSCKDAIKMILDAGGIPILAHPGLIKPDNDKKFHPDHDTNDKYAFEHLISQLIYMGIMGIEVFHTDHTKEQTDLFAKIAFKKGLIITGGSDFHGTMKLGVEMGKGNGNLDISNDYYKMLFQAVEQVRKNSNQLSILEENFYHSFKDKELLQTALRHSSFVNEVSQLDIKDNQRLEFLGDAVLGLAIADLLMNKFPEMKEGDLSKLRSNIVSESGLAAMARYMDVGRFISFGKGERLSRGAEKNSILADTFEAIIAAIYLELGFEQTKELISVYFDSQISRMTSANDTFDYKSLLQEIVQEMGNYVPSYKIIRETGPDHDKTFEVVLNVLNIEAKGEGKNKKTAEQNAAANAVAILRQGSELPLP